MLALEVRFLTGRYAATHFNDRGRAEWPPHPARVYSALVAALHDDPDHGPEERDALKWLAAAGPPRLVASQATARAQREVYVPTNDASALSGIDNQLVKLREAELALEAADGSKARARMQTKLAKALEAVAKSSAKSGAADGKGAPGSARAVLPAGRSRQPRHFPVSFPDEPVVHLCWAEAPPDATVRALDRVAARVARLGHSSSLVSMRVTSDSGEEGERTTWVPDERGELILRVPTEGQLRRLEEQHARHQQVEPRVLPGGFVAYDPARPSDEGAVAGSSFDDRGWISFQVASPSLGGRRYLLDASLAQQVARALRGTLLRNGGKEWPETLSGHAPDGTPAQGAHLAFVPLADVGHEHASGSILGVALIPPRDLDAHARDVLARAIGGAEALARQNDPEGSPPKLRLTLGRNGVLHLQRLRDLPALKTLQTQTWTRASRRWVSATAIALDRNPGNLGSRDAATVARAVAEAEAIVAASCTHVGLPEPAAVWVHARSLLAGAPAARRFMPFPSTPNGPRRVCVHAEVLFDEPVRGPVMLGAGRYFGLGLCRPV